MPEATAPGQVAGSGKLALRVERVARPLEAWDRFVADDPASTFCHLAGWHEVLSETLGAECVYLAAVDEGGRWHGVLPLAHVRGLLGHFLVSIPFVNDGGPLGAPEARRLLVEHAVAEARRSGARTLELRSREPVPGPVTPAFRKVTVHLDLPDAVEALWTSTFKAKLRSQIRRPEKEGMTAAVGHEHLDAFYDVFARNMRDLGTPVLPRAFFERLARVFGDRVMFGAVYTAEGAPAAAGCCLAWREEVEITWASSVRALNRFSPNMLLYARLMEASVARGARLFNFGRCTPDGPTHRFKRQWGGRDVPLPWATWSRDGAASMPSPSSAKFRLATAVWSRMPMWAANRLGPVLARQLP